MASQEPLAGVELIDCAKANAAQGIAVAANLCGYGEDTEGFLQAVRKAGKDMGVSIDELQDLDEAESAESSASLENLSGRVKDI